MDSLMELNLFIVLSAIWYASLVAWFYLVFTVLLADFGLVAFSFSLWLTTLTDFFLVFSIYLAEIL